MDGPQAKEPAYVLWRGNDFFQGGPWLIKKMKICQFSKILLYKSWILGGGGLGPPAWSHAPAYVSYLF